VRRPRTAHTTRSRSQTKTALLCTSEQVHNRYTMQIFGNDCCISCLRWVGRRRTRSRSARKTIGRYDPSVCWCSKALVLGSERRVKRYIGKLHKQLLFSSRTQLHSLVLDCRREARAREDEVAWLCAAPTTREDHPDDDDDDFQLHFAYMFAHRISPDTVQFHFGCRRRSFGSLSTRLVLFFFSRSFPLQRWRTREAFLLSSQLFTCQWDESCASLVDVVFVLQAVQWQSLEPAHESIPSLLLLPSPLLRCSSG
jgi:hypothetical protein